MFNLTGKDFYQNIEKMNTETENAKKQTQKMQQTSKEIDKISAEMKNAAEVNDGKKMLDLIQQMTNMVAKIVD